VGVVPVLANLFMNPRLRSVQHARDIHESVSVCLQRDPNHAHKLLDLLSPEYMSRMGT
jgi:hypothetical protein